jgi:predicted  nucleic acid-binding Zn-ribbon protein
MSPKERITLLRRGFAFGYRAALRKARKDLHAITENFDAEIARLEDEFRELREIGETVSEVRRELHHERVNRAIREAVDERAANPDAWLH